MNKKLFLKATVTGKRQITIPQEICKLFNIQIGSQIIFRENEDRKILFEVENKNKPCFACNAAGKIKNNTCFICNGRGTLKSDIYSDIYKFIGFISLNANKHNIKIDYIYEEDIPNIYLTSPHYDKELLKDVASKIQDKINESFK